MISQNIPHQLTRRRWLRNTTLSATGLAVLPLLLSNCTDHVEPELGTPLDPPITEDELRSAAQNLLNMNAWITNLYVFTGNYEQYVIETLKSGKERPKDWTNFIISIFTDIAIGIIGVAAASVPGLGAAIGAAVALASENIKTWTSSGSLPHNLEAEFAEFKHAHLQMQIAISDMLLKLADKTDNYKNLREGWKGDIDFNGKKYNLRDLANSQFPTEDEGDNYVKLRTTAYDAFRKYIWNLMIMKAGNMTHYYIGSRFYIYSKSANEVVREFYSTDANYAASYIRGYYHRPYDSYYYFEEFYFEFDGKRLSADAAKELFKDDVRDHIINPEGLFNRDYVYKQFHTERPDFLGYYDMSTDTWKHNPPELDFDVAADNYVFTGGDFPQLVKK